jgi:hypothetical protein
MKRLIRLVLLTAVCLSLAVIPVSADDMKPGKGIATMNDRILLGCLATAALLGTGCPSEDEQFLDATESSTTGGTDESGSSTETDGTTTGMMTTTVSATDTPTTSPGEPTTGIGSSGGESSDGSSESGLIEGELTVAELAVEGIEPLANGFHFELWAIIDDAPITVGKFNIDASGAVVDLDGVAIPDAHFNAGRDISVASSFVLTIEAAGDNDITPGISKYLAGPLMGDSSRMTLDSETALGTDFSESEGTFILATPTDGPDSLAVDPNRGLAHPLKQNPHRAGYLTARPRSLPAPALCYALGGDGPGDDLARAP